MGFQSFFEKLSGSKDYEEEDSAESKTETKKEKKDETEENRKEWLYSEPEGQLTIDVFQTPKEFVIQSIVAGVKSDELDISITNEMVTIRGERKREKSDADADYLYQELYWGAFSRSILLPNEIDASRAEAVFKNGIITIKLPKLEKEKIQKIKIKYKDE